MREQQQLLHYHGILSHVQRNVFFLNLFLIKVVLLLNVQAPTFKPNPQTLVYVPYNTHYQTLTNVQSGKMHSKLINCKRKFVKSIHKNTHLRMAKPTPHTLVSFLGQASMHNYFILYLLTHTIIPKGTQFF
jgi:hypothetical protein